eukprot:2934077-Rhodomonas_salina.1
MHLRHSAAFVPVVAPVFAPALPALCQTSSASHVADEMALLCPDYFNNTEGCEEYYYDEDYRPAYPGQGPVL